MGVGHLAVGLASKRWAPQVSLGWLVLAPLLLDLLFPVFFLLGLEHMRIVPGFTRAMPLDLEYIGLSHSLVAALGWSCLLAGVYFARHRDGRVAALLFGGVTSHFVLDWISHGPDMPILPHGERFGLGLWNHPVAAIGVEAGMLAVGLLLYLRSSGDRSRGSLIGVGVLAGLLLLVNVGAYFGPPPPSATAAAAGNLLMIPIVWGFARLDRAPGPAPRRTPHPSSA